MSAVEEQEVWIPKCWVCMDEGLVRYWKDGYWFTDRKIPLEYVAKCLCSAGAKDRYACFPPVAAVLDPEALAAENFKKWYAQNKDKPGVKEKMRERGIPIPDEAA